MSDHLRALLDLWWPILLVACAIDAVCYAVIGVAIWIRRKG